MPKTLARESAPHQVPVRGFLAVEFICPRCGTKRWGTTHGRGHCNGFECGFSWEREFDWLYFHRRADGRAFLSGEAFEATIAPVGPAIAYERPTVTYVCNVNDLVEDVS